MVQSLVVIIWGKSQRISVRLLVIVITHGRTKVWKIGKKSGYLTWKIPVLLNKYFKTCEYTLVEYELRVWRSPVIWWWSLRCFVVKKMFRGRNNFGPCGRCQKSSGIEPDNERSGRWIRKIMSVDPTNTLTSIPIAADDPGQFGTIRVDNNSTIPVWWHWWTIWLIARKCWLVTDGCSVIDRTFHHQLIPTHTGQTFHQTPPPTFTGVIKACVWETTHPGSGELVSRWFIIWFGGSGSCGWLEIPKQFFAASHSHT